MSDARLSADAKLVALEQEFAALDSRFDEAGAADLDQAFDALCSTVGRIVGAEAFSLGGINVKSRVAARLEANGWDDLMELVAQSLARDALRLTAPAA